MTTRAHQPGELRCEHLHNPLGLEASRPRLSWQIACARRGARQTAYRIAVASAPDLLARGTADLWDSGRVESDASVLVPYAGQKLSSRQLCVWQVHVWDENGDESVSEPAHWEMGLLRSTDWKAQWITGNIPQKYDQVPASPIFRKAFTLKKP